MCVFVNNSRILTLNNQEMHRKHSSGATAPQIS